MNVITAILDLLGLIKPAPLGYQYEFVDVPSSVTNLGTGEAIFSQARICSRFIPTLEFRE